MIKITEVSKYFANQQVLDNINLNLHEGDFLLLFGVDDAGKTTLLHILMGFDMQYKGTVEVFGQLPNDIGKEYRSQLRFVPDDILWESMTALEFFDFCKNTSDNYESALQEKLCEEFEIPVREYLLDMTYQENKLVQIIAAVCAKPKLLILDEPRNFLSDAAYRRLLQYLKTWNKEGMTILLAVETYKEVGFYGNCYAYLKEGSIIASGRIPEPDYRNKVVTTSGGSQEYLDGHMERLIAERNGKRIYLYKKKMGDLLNILQESGCLDCSIEDMTLEEEIEQDYSRWE